MSSQYLSALQNYGVLKASAKDKYFFLSVKVPREFELYSVIAVYM